MYAVAFSFGGIPLIYMGDELAMRNDTGWALDQVHEHDNRWMHRPRMDWAVAARRHDPDSLEGRMFAALRASWREFRGRKEWELTKHVGAHLVAPAPTSAPTRV